MPPLINKFSIRKIFNLKIVILIVSVFVSSFIVLSFDLKDLDVSAQSQNQECIRPTQQIVACLGSADLFTIGEHAYFKIFVRAESAIEANQYFGEIQDFDTRWREYKDPNNSDISYVDSNNRKYFITTISGQPETGSIPSPENAWGDLISCPSFELGINTCYASDGYPEREIRNPLYLTSNFNRIEKMFQVELMYNNSPDRLRYGFPHVTTPGYNSNSFARGILQFMGVDFDQQFGYYGYNLNIAGSLDTAPGWHQSIFLHSSFRNNLQNLCKYYSEKLISFYDDYECILLDNTYQALYEEYSFGSPSDAGIFNLVHSDLSGVASSIKLKESNIPVSVMVYDNVNGENGIGSSRCINQSIGDLRNLYYTNGDINKNIDNSIIGFKLFYDNTCGGGFNVRPEFEFLEPNGIDDKASSYFDIFWIDEDQDSNASISFYYTEDYINENGTLITSGINEDNELDNMRWDMSNIPNGQYYIYAIISDELSTITKYNPNPITVSHNTASNCAGRIITNGENLICETTGDIFKFIGVNMRELAYLDRERSGEQPPVADLDQAIQSELIAAKEMGATVVRFYAPNYQNTSTQSDTIAAIQRVLTNASIVAPEMKFNITLTDSIKESNNILDEDQQYYEKISNPLTGELSQYSYLTDEWFFSAYKINFLPYVQTVVETFKDNNQIFSWDIINEPKVRNMIAASGNTKNNETGMLTFVYDVGNAIKQYDPNHLVTVGLLETDHSVDGSYHSDEIGPAQYLSDMYNSWEGQESPIDFGVIHTYNHEFTKPEIMRDVNWFQSSNFPYIIQEFGYDKNILQSTLNNITIPATSEDRSTAIERVSHVFFENYNASGLMQWAFTSNQPNPLTEEHNAMNKTKFSDWDNLFDVYQCRSDILNYNHTQETINLQKFEAHILNNGDQTKEFTPGEDVKLQLKNCMISNIVGNSILIDYYYAKVSDISNPESITAQDLVNNPNIHPADGIVDIIDNPLKKGIEMSPTIEWSIPVGIYEDIYIFANVQEGGVSNRIILNAPMYEKLTYKSGMDVSFVIDSTGSMGDKIASLTTELGSLVQTFKTYEGEERYSLIDYKDKDEPEWYGADIKARFTRSTAIIQNAYNDILWGSGDDFEEDVYIGLDTAINELNWRPSTNQCSRVIILVGDAPPKTFNRTESDPSFASVVSDANSKGIRIFSYYVGEESEHFYQEGSFQQLSQRTNGGTAFLHGKLGHLDEEVSKGIQTCQSDQRAPTIEPIQDQEISIDTPFTYPVIANDPDNDELTYKKEIGPEGLSINSDTGLISWTPGVTALGEHNVKISVTDGNFITTVDFKITVVDPASPPSLIPIADQTVIKGQQLSIQLNVEDENHNESFTFTFGSTIPTGMSINNSVLQWTAGNSGTYTITVTVTDKDGLTDSETFTITVVEQPSTPPVVIPPSTNGVTINLCGVGTGLGISGSSNPYCGGGTCTSNGTNGSCTPNFGYYIDIYGCTDKRSTNGHSAQYRCDGTNGGVKIGSTYLTSTDLSSFFNNNAFEQYCTFQFDIHGIGNPIPENFIVWERNSCLQIPTPPSFNCGYVTEITYSECKALEKLFQSTQGNNWSNKSGWLQYGVNPCTWYGVSCNGSNVISLNLNSNNLNGNLPSVIGNLTKLELLNLNFNNLSGGIPKQIGNIKDLKYLYLSLNHLSGSIPSEIGNLNKLEQLYLGSNELTGSIPTSIKKLNNLQEFLAYSNQLSGNIPTEFSSLSNLVQLNLGTNQLSGTIPASIGNIATLQRLVLDNNLLTGSVPSQLGNLNNLTQLVLYQNQLSGSIPVEISNLSNLEDLFISYNQLTGEIPTELQNLDKLKILSLSNNLLSGIIPTELSNLNSIEEIYLENNQLIGAIPSEFGNLEILKKLKLDRNLIDGEISESLFDLELNALSLFSTGICISQNQELQTWLSSIIELNVSGLEECPRISANFTVNIPVGIVPVTVQFTDTSESINTTINSWQWDLNNDGITDSTDQNPTFTYTDPGLFSVSLTISDGTLFNSTTKNDFITSAHNFKKEIIIDNNEQVYTDYDFELNINTAELISAGLVNPQCSNIKFLNSNNVILEYFVESGCGEEYTDIWIRIPNLPTGQTILNMMYGANILPVSKLNWNGGRMLAAFDSSCPSGWSYLSELNDQDRFAMGSQDFGQTGGSETHNHTYSGQTGPASAWKSWQDGGSQLNVEKIILTVCLVQQVLQIMYHFIKV